MACHRVFEFPYVDHAGKESVFPLARWNCHPLTYVGSLVATKFARIFAIIRKRFPWRIAKTYRELTFKVAAASAISHSNWIIDRFLGVSKQNNKKRVCFSMLNRVLCSLDDIQRFVYDQVCSQTYWLSSRSERPRDKSSKTKSLDPFDLLFLEGSRGSCACGDPECIYGVAQAWPHIVAKDTVSDDFDTHSDYSGW
jgi:hypothetical protein